MTKNRKSSEILVDNEVYWEKISLGKFVLDFLNMLFWNRRGCFIGSGMWTPLGVCVPQVDTTQICPSTLYQPLSLHPSGKNPVGAHAAIGFHSCFYFNTTTICAPIWSTLHLLTLLYLFVLLLWVLTVLKCHSN